MGWSEVSKLSHISRKLKCENKSMQNSYKRCSFLRQQCSWGCNISSYDWRILSPLCPLLMKMLNCFCGARVLDKVQSPGVCLWESQGESGGKMSRAVPDQCASHWKKGGDLGRWQSHITARLDLYSTVLQGAAVIVLLVCQRGWVAKHFRMQFVCLFFNV